MSGALCRQQCAWRLLRPHKSAYDLGGSAVVKSLTSACGDVQAVGAIDVRQLQRQLMHATLSSVLPYGIPKRSFEVYTATVDGNFQETEQPSRGVSILKQFGLPFVDYGLAERHRRHFFGLPSRFTPLDVRPPLHFALHNCNARTAFGEVLLSMFHPHPLETCSGHE